MKSEKSTKVLALAVLTACVCYETLGALAVRYVATDGAETNDGLSAATPFASIAQAVTDLGEQGGRVYVAAGTYVIDFSSAETITLTTPVEIEGATGDPKDVVVRRPTNWDAAAGRLFKLSHADAAVRNLTIEKGLMNTTSQWAADSGANVWITTNGGTIENCIIRGGDTSRSWPAGGANVFMQGGRLSCCRLEGGVNNTDAQNAWVLSGGSLAVRGGVVENCLITGCSSGAAPVGIYGAAEMVNCTIAGNGCGVASALIVGAVSGTGTLPSVVNCAFFDNGDKTPVKGSVMDKAVTDDDYARQAFARCAAATAINDECLVVADPMFMDAGAGDYRPQAASPLTDRGLVYVQTSAKSRTDVDGRPRVSGKAVDIGACESDRVRNVYLAAVTAEAGDNRVALHVALADHSLAGEAAITVYRDGVAQEVRYRDLKAGESYDATFGMPGAYAFKVELKGSVGQTREQWAHAFLAASGTPHRIVSTLGYDTNTGLTEDTAFRTLAKAVSDLPEGGTVYLAPGTYRETGNGAEGITNAVHLTTPVKIVALAGDPAATVLRPAAGGWRALWVNHAEAAVRGLTITGGSMPNLTGADEPRAHGGNVRLEKGLVENCVIRDGVTKGWSGAGANVMMKGGRLAGCTLIGGKVVPTAFTTNSWYYTGSSLYAEGGVVENCIVRDCSSGFGPVSLNGTAKMVNSTVVNNTGVNCGGVAIGNSTSVSVVNCAIFGGRVTSGAATASDAVFGQILRKTNLRADPESAFDRCAAEVAINDTCVVTDAPRFADPESGDFTIDAESPLVNAGRGYSSTAATSAYDVNGAERVFGAAVDIGACECYLTSGARFTEKNIGLGDGTVVVRMALIQKTAPVDVKVHVYRDGVAIDEQVFGIAYGLDLTLTYSVPGYYVVKYDTYLSGDEVVSAVLGDAYLAGDSANIQFVSTTGSDANDGVSQATSKLTVQAAVDALGATGGKVYVAEGTYAGTNAVNVIKLAAPVQVIGLTTDPKRVKLTKNSGTNARIVRLTHADAAVRNVWVAGGYIWSTTVDGAQVSPAGDSGGAVMITTAGGTVENCVISDGVTLVYAGGGGNVFMTGGRLSGCLIEGGYACNDVDDQWSLSGSSVCMQGGVMENCVVRGAVGRLENGVRKRLAGAPICLFEGARMVNCTVVDNMGSAAGGVLIRKIGTSGLPSIVNCAFYNNVVTGTGAASYQTVFKESRHRNEATVTLDEARSVFRGCAAAEPINEDCLAADDPCFRDAANGDYSLRAGSPLLEKGVDYAAAGGVSAFDRAGAARIFRRIDVGAYERPYVRLLAKVRGLLIYVR